MIDLHGKFCVSSDSGDGPKKSGGPEKSRDAERRIPENKEFWVAIAKKVEVEVYNH
jgi:hypothetical protein